MINKEIQKGREIIMDYEAIDIQNAEEINSTVEADAGTELTICDCDAVAEETACEDAPCETTEAACSYADLFAQKCKEVTEACRHTANRLVSDWKETAGKPYVKQTTVCRVDIYRSPEDETPVDTFCTERVKTYSARAMAILGTAAVAVMCTADCVIKKLTNK